MANIFDQILRQTITVTPSTVGIFDRGNYVDADSTPYDIIAGVQPISGEVVDSMGIGRRGIGKIKVYTRTELTVSGTGNYKRGDYISWKGNNYEIIAKEKDQSKLVFLNGPTNHYKYVGELRENDEVA